MAAIIQSNRLERVRVQFEIFVSRARNTWSKMGALCFAVVAALIGFVVVLLAPAMVENYRLTHQSAVVIASTPVRLSASVQEEVARFHRQFPPSTLFSSFVAQLNEFADAAGVRITQADFRPIPDPSGLTRYQAAVTLRGSYVSARQFLARCLTEIPVLAIDSLGMSRATSSDGLVDAQLRLSIYLAPE